MVSVSRDLRALNRSWSVGGFGWSSQFSFYQVMFLYMTSRPQSLIVIGSTKVYFHGHRKSPWCSSSEPKSEWRTNQLVDILRSRHFNPWSRPYLVSALISKYLLLLFTGGNKRIEITRMSYGNLSLVFGNQPSIYDPERSHYWLPICNFVRIICIATHRNLVKPCIGEDLKSARNSWWDSFLLWLKSCAMCSVDCCH